MHKRWFALILMIAVIPGCSERRIETSPSEALYETKPRDDLGFSSFYAPEDTVLTLPPDISDANRFCFLRENILIFSGYPETVLTLLDGNTFKTKAELVLPPHAGAAEAGDGITYTDEQARMLVFLDSELREIKRLPLPEGCGRAVLSADAQLLYYCTSDSLRVLNPADGTDRPLKEMRFPMQEITGLHCSDSVVECRILDDGSAARSLFLSAETGRLLYETTEDIPLWTVGNLYCALCMDGAYRQLIFGSAESGPSVLETETEADAVTPVLSRKLVLLHTQQVDGSLVLDAYHLETGNRIAQITLPGSSRIADIQPDPRENGLWILCQDAADGRNTLRYWDTDIPVTTGSQICFQPLRSHENPDLEGLEECRIAASAISEKHGVQILLRADIPADPAHRFEAEYQVPLIRRMLLQLDHALSQYPVGFLEELAGQTESGRLNICLVRSISPSDLPAFLYWDQREAYLMLTPTPELERQTHSLLLDLIDCRVLGVRDTYDSWDRSSPTGSGHRERIEILKSAMTEGCSESFASAVMQEKLRRICLGIREAFHTVKTVPELPWEQYLADTA